jgi:hypothetical protein
VRNFDPGVAERARSSRRRLRPDAVEVVHALDGIARDNLGAVTIAGARPLTRTNNSSTRSPSGPGRRTPSTGGFFHTVNAATRIRGGVRPGTTRRSGTNVACPLSPASTPSTRWRWPARSTSAGTSPRGRPAAGRSPPSTRPPGRSDLGPERRRRRVPARDLGTTVYAAGSFQKSTTPRASTTSPASARNGGDRPLAHRRRRRLRVGTTGTNVVGGPSARRAGRRPAEALRRDNLGAIDLTTGQATGGTGTAAPLRCGLRHDGLRQRRLHDAPHINLAAFDATAP